MQTTWPDAMSVMFGPDGAEVGDDEFGGLVRWCDECGVDVQGGSHPQCAMARIIGGEGLEEVQV